MGGSRAGDRDTIIFARPLRFVQPLFVSCSDIMYTI
jgi:hypothetical protein